MASALTGLHSADAGPQDGRQIPPCFCALLPFVLVQCVYPQRRLGAPKRCTRWNQNISAAGTINTGGGEGVRWTPPTHEFQVYQIFRSSWLGFDDRMAPYDSESREIQIANLASIHLSSWPAGDDSLPSATAWWMDVICWVRNDMLPWRYAWAAAALINSLAFT